MINDIATKEFFESAKRYGSPATTAYDVELLSRAHLSQSAVDCVLEAAKRYGFGDTERTAAEQFRDEIKRLGVAS